jgi:multiple sugar transport system substrate-binding protein
VGLSARHTLAAPARARGATAGRAPVQVIFWNGDWTPHEYPLFQSIIDRFNASHPGIVVKELANSFNDTKLLAAITAGDAPDVVEMQPTNVGAWGYRGALLDLTPFIKSTHFDIASVTPAVVKAGTLHGKIYALGSLFDGAFLYWNKDLFKAAGLDPNAPPRTIAAFDTLNAKLTVRNSNGTFKSVGFFPQMDGGGLFTWGNVFGGSFYNPATGKIAIDDPRVVQALAWETSYFTRYGAENVNRYAHSSFGTGALAQFGPFGFQQAAMDVNGEYMAGDWYATYAKNLHFGLAALPVLHTGDQPASIVIPNAAAIPAGAKHPQEAWEFLAYLLNPANTAFLANRLDSMPQAAALYSDAGLKQITVPTLHTLVAIFRTEREFYYPVVENSTYRINQIGIAEGNATLGKMTPKQALDQATTNAQNDLNKITGGQ